MLRLERWELLNDTGVFILPREIDHDIYAELLHALIIRADKEVKLYCAGIGGSHRDAMAMVDLIRQHGNVTALLAGEAGSSHVNIWAGCARRFVYPFGGISIHRVAWNSIDTRVDAKYARLLADDYELADQTTARMLADISSVPFSEWLSTIDHIGSGSSKFFDAQTVISLGMARPISEYKPGITVNINVVNTASQEDADKFVSALSKAKR